MNVLTACILYPNIADHRTPSDVIKNIIFWLDQGIDIETPDGQCLWKPLHYVIYMHIYICLNNIYIYNYISIYECYIYIYLNNIYI